MMLMVIEEGWSKFSPRDKGERGEEERVQSSLQKISDHEAQFSIIVLCFYVFFLLQYNAINLCLFPYLCPKKPWISRASALSSAWLRPFTCTSQSHVRYLLSLMWLMMIHDDANENDLDLVIRFLQNS